MQTHLERHDARRSPQAPAPDGAPLLLVHGLGGDRHSWSPLLPGLTETRDVLVAELPGFGVAPPLPDDIEPTPAALAADVVRALDAAGVERVHVVGHSLGGWVALELAELAPARVRSVVAITPAGFWSRPLAAHEGRAIKAGRRLSPVLPALLAPRRVRNAVLHGVLGGSGGFGYTDALAVVRGYVRAADYERVSAAMRARVYDVRSRLAPLAARIPVHVVWATLDRAVTAPRAALPAAVHVHVLDGAGHLPMFEQPDRIVTVLLAAADSHGAAAGAA
ncbi:alpha/beta fold hydrolase [Patulibacter americanus]|uniref:alpha/beta fold hydrolase n=1 Tax=Patulibacter americanus TaxID=588672 RepID=UPI000418DDCF|nr:alpha/beta fold hydrolase [Patulibacter americanus]